MLTEDLIKNRLAQYQMELVKLQSDHDEMVKGFNQKVSQNQSRYAQIQGAMAELKELIKHELPDSGNTNWKPDSSTGRIPDDHHRAGHYLGPFVGNRELDQPYTSTSKISVGDNPPDPGDPVGAGGTDGK